MIRLNEDVLYSVAKVLLENDDQDILINFALSGKNCFESVIKCFQCVEVVKLYETFYEIGWDDKKTSRFYNEILLSKYFFQHIGKSIKSLTLGCEENAFNSSLISTISKGENVTNLVINIISNCNVCIKIINECRSSLNGIRIPYDMLSKLFHHIKFSLNFFAVMDNSMIEVMSFNFEKLFLMIDVDFWLWKQILVQYFFNSCVNDLSRITHLCFKSKTIGEYAFSDVNPVFLLKVFKNLKEIKFDLELSYLNKLNVNGFEIFIKKFINVFRTESYIPSTFIYYIHGCKIPVFMFLERSFILVDESYGLHYRKKFIFDGLANMKFVVLLTD